MLNSTEAKLDKRVIRTRKLLREAFFELMNERVFQQITVQEITERAMLNRATFYDHFTDKYELFDYSVKMMFQEHLDKTIGATNRLTYDNLYALSLSTLEFLSHFVRHCAPSERQVDLPFEKQIQAHLREVLYQWLNQVDPTQIPKDTSTDLVATATSSTIFGASIHYANGNSSLTQEAYLDQLLNLIMNGICPIVCD